MSAEHHGDGAAASLSGRYVRLGLQLGRHVEGLVDAYFGPPEWAAEVEAAPPAEPDAAEAGDADAAPAAESGSAGAAEADADGGETAATAEPAADDKA